MKSWVQLPEVNINTKTKSLTTSLVGDVLEHFMLSSNRVRAVRYTSGSHHPCFEGVG